MLIQIIVSGLVAGSLYALIALGLVMVYKATEVVNFAQGEVVMLGAYIGYVFYVSLNLSFFLTFFMTMAALAIIGVLMERVVYRPLMNAPILSIIIATLAMLILLRGLVKLFMGGGFYAFPVPMIMKGNAINFGKHFLIPRLNLWILASSVLIMLILFAFFKYTKMGKSMRAVSCNKKAALLMGISVRKVFSMTWAISSVVGGISGLIIAPLVQIDPEMGFIIVKGFTAAVLGGFTSLPGAIGGGLLLGLIENISTGYMAAGYKDVITFLVLICVLVFKPTGLFEKPKKIKV